MNNNITHSVLINSFEEDTKWLLNRGWKPTGKYHEEDGFKGQIWTNNKGKAGVHCYFVGFKKYEQAVDLALLELLYELRWKSIEVYHFIPNYILYEGNTVYTLKHKMQYFLHPTSKKIYSFLEASDIARYFNNDDIVAKKQNFLSVKTKELQQQLENKEINDVLVVQFKLVNNSHKWIVLNK